MSFLNVSQYHISFHQKPSNEPKLKKIVNEDEFNNYVDQVIKEEKSQGKIESYRDYLTNSEKRRFKKDLQGSLAHYVINNNLHIIKHGQEKDTFTDKVIDITKKQQAQV